ncbi:MAG: glycosyltransferase family 2 protein [Crenarchaeota archaeon]|nr:MAG: glycosyltransferase family 2 protein [Thermoproteota archaeon]RDJ33346.1 MAG: glycosyltransferase family 2 protein [Thermoproteota archaeon]RDJ36150.1 MAG: glycosyltransferase family 2 protein [Thermoproteota archaeon]RDJ38782.1 MAG: glycosyltransferase family 2 protein [Thermoproteota archaeon]
MESNEKPIPKICIGLPVYNGEKFIRNAIDSLLAQTYTNFEIIISDNGSNDKTELICKEYVKKDCRVKYKRHKKNMGGIWNFNYVLEEAKSEYFMWAGVDDVWSSKFLEKNIVFLESNKKYVGSIGEVITYNSISKELIFEKEKYVKDKNFEHVHPIIGDYGKKVNFILKFCRASLIYGIFNRKVLKNSFIKNYFPTWDLAVILNIVKNGDIQVIPDVVLYRYVRDNPSPSKIKRLLDQNIPILKIVFFEVPFTYWCAKNIGKKNFSKNVHLFFVLNMKAEYTIILEVLRMCKRMVSGKNKFWI